jgi:molybdopterin converting factor small subunit
LVSLRFTAAAKPSVRDAIWELANTFQKFSEATIDPELNDPRPNLLILLNGAEISVLDGLKTKIQNGDRLVLIPVTHGG